MLKMITLISSFLMGRMNQQTESPTQAIFEKILSKTRVAFLATALGLTSIGVLVGGLLLTTVEITRQLDLSGYVYLSATLWGGIALIAIPLIALSIAYSKAGPESPRKQERKQADQKPEFGIEQAVSLLILDIVKERESKRMEAQAERQAKEEMRARAQQAPADPMTTSEQPTTVANQFAAGPTEHADSSIH